MMFRLISFADSSLAVTAGGCFPGNSKVLREDWTEMAMRDLGIGDKIWTIDLLPTMTSASPSFWFYSTELESSDERSNVRHSSSSSPYPLGNLVLTEVITFLHKEPNKEVEFATFESDTNLQKPLTTTANHLVYVASRPNRSNISNVTSGQSEDNAGSHPSLEIFPTFAASVKMERHRLVHVQPSVDCRRSCSLDYINKGEEIERSRSLCSSDLAWYPISERLLGILLRHSCRS